ncbi:MAG: hypothetical protein DWH99_00775 [Planctomycetota bacterium]|nr:MAG: hypothetical protein DWH99_00775 [Planctomycetota bacterium]
MDLVSWYVGIVVAQAEEATQDGALVTALRNRLVESGPVTAQVRRFESHRCKGGHKRAKRVVMLREQLLGRWRVWHDKHLGWVSPRR